MKYINKQAVLLTIISVLLSGKALAVENQSGTSAYVGVGPTLWMYMNEYERGMATGTALSVRGGVRADSGMGGELRYMSGGSGSLGGMNVELDSAISFLATYSTQYSETSRGGIYLGLTSGKMTYSGSFWGYDYEVSDSDSGFSFGAEFETALTDEISFYFDYGTYIIKSEYLVQGISAGLKANF